MILFAAMRPNFHHPASRAIRSSTWNAFHPCPWRILILQHFLRPTAQVLENHDSDGSSPAMAGEDPPGQLAAIWTGGRASGMRPPFSPAFRCCGGSGHVYFVSLPRAPRRAVECAQRGRRSRALYPCPSAPPRSKIRRQTSASPGTWDGIRYQECSTARIDYPKFRCRSASASVF